MFGRILAFVVARNLEKILLRPYAKIAEGGMDCSIIWDVAFDWRLPCISVSFETSFRWHSYAGHAQLALASGWAPASLNKDNM